MILEELAVIEDKLYTIVLDLYQQQTGEGDDKLKRVFVTYKQIHKLYSTLAADDLEALKRGLFIQWYALTEPNYLTGINDIDEQAEIEIITFIDKSIESNKLDTELEWMLSYYANWDFVFVKFKTFSNLQSFLIQSKAQLPKSIDIVEMKERGQMGKYWNSLYV